MNADLMILTSKKVHSHVGIASTGQQAWQCSAAFNAHFNGWWTNLTASTGAWSDGNLGPGFGVDVVGVLQHNSWDERGQEQVLEHFAGDLERLTGGVH